MKCYYEVLNVPKNADLAEIKASYKKLALKWHPDKNLDNQEYAKEQFQIVQQAYEVLSDRQEREWYDNHREQILRGSSSGYEDNSLNVFPYFTASCFNGYSDSEEGFYSVYRNVFEKIAKEDIEYIENKDEFISIPTFGNSQSDYKEVVKPFYDYWMNYCTKKSYVWLDPYDISQIRDRKSVKLAEKENKKVRQQARKERNDEVRALVAFVRKRDKRVQAQLHLIEAQKMENKQKMEQLKLQKKLERNAQLNQESIQPDWAKFDNFKSELREIEKNLAKQFSEEFSNSESEEEEEEEYDDNLYCVACNKVFKTPKTFKNHELSKKHKENVIVLKQEMYNEEDKDSFYEESGILSDEANLVEENDNEIVCKKEEVEDCSKIKRKKQKTKILLPHKDEETDVSCFVHVEEDLLNFDDDFDMKKQKKKKSKNKKTKSKCQSSEQKEYSDESDIDEARKHTQKKNRKSTVKVDDTPPVDINHCCVTCKSTFSSKNKLYDHLKKSGHSVYLPDSKIKQQKEKNKCIK